MELLNVFTEYTFWIGFSAMVAGAVYFALERQALAVEFQPVASLCAAVAIVAAINYWEMAHLFGSGSAAMESGEFPTRFRYIDWLLTTPMLLAVVPILARIEEGRGALLAKLLVADVIMIAAGFVGEVTINDGMAPTVWGWIGFAVGTLAFFYILFTLFSTMTAAEAVSDPKLASGVNALKKFILLSWPIYPIGFLVALVGEGAGFTAGREIVYNVADIVSKVGFGIVAVAAARSASWERAD